VDQLKSITPGVVAQLKGIIAKRRYTCVTVFVGHFSRLGYLHMQQQLKQNMCFRLLQDLRELPSNITMQIMGDLLTMPSSRM
jgi:hypothetical protein